MSDRVLYLVGNTPNRDCVNWPTVLDSELAGVSPGLTDELKNRNWPIDVTQAQLMAMAWRVRTWRLTGTVSANWNRTLGDDVFTNSINGECNKRIGWAADDNADSIAVNERSILTRAFNISGHQFLGGYIIPDPEEENNYWHCQKTGPFLNDSVDIPIFDLDRSNLDVLTLLHAEELFVIYRPETGLFSPVIWFFANVIYSVGGFEAVHMRLQTARAPVFVHPPAASVAGTLTVDPKIAPSFEVPLQMIVSGFHIGDDSVDASGSAELTLTAEFFWPYANTAGHRVYDENSGAQINDPFG